MSNSINVIKPYKHIGLWVFDDSNNGLKKEPFIAGADVFIDIITSSIVDADEGFSMLFSDIPFPGYQYKLDWRYSESGGNWYCSKEYDHMGWLCPALLKYFAKAPKNLYVQVKSP